MPTIKLSPCNCTSAQCYCGAAAQYAPPPVPDHLRYGKAAAANPCGEAHPANDAPAAFYRDRLGQMHSNEMNMSCQLERGHKGRHACFRRWASMPQMGEEHRWAITPARTA